jgi:large subunit ribosomal protein L23
MLKPLFSLKSAAHQRRGAYVFAVQTSANKVEIAKTVEKKYGVSVSSVNTMRCMGKKVSQRTRKGIITGCRSSFKKAIVFLKEGATINFQNEVQ